ncbi:MAG: protein kinase [Pirellulales bacterium]|nr:protein kinase [Pirellulales bacterium]
MMADKNQPTATDSAASQQQAGSSPSSGSASGSDTPTVDHQAFAAEAHDTLAHEVDVVVGNGGPARTGQPRQAARPAVPPVSASGSSPVPTLGSDQPPISASGTATPPVARMPVTAPGSPPISESDSANPLVSGRAPAGSPPVSAGGAPASPVSPPPTLSQSDDASSISIEVFLDCLSQSGLLTAAELSEVREEYSSSDVARDAWSLAAELVRRQRLTEYQAQALCQGKSRGLTLGNYVILDELGAGGMGVVFKAEHRRMKRQVAVKLLPPTLTNSPNAISRFHREVEAAAKLTHPNIVAAYDADEAAGAHFLVMEYVAGTDLSRFVRSRGVVDVATAVDLISQVARGLDHAHRRGVVHRDIKPGNLLLDEHGVVKILDMGLARVVESDLPQEELTQSGRLMGTVDYMAPEQALDVKRADQRADVYSLGCTLYFLLAGKAIAPEGTMTTKLLWHQSHPVPSLLEVVPDAPPALDALFQRMLAKRPEDRPQSMAEVLQALEPIRRQLGLSSEGDAPWLRPAAPGEAGVPRAMAEAETMAAPIPSTVDGHGAAVTRPETMAGRMMAAPDAVAVRSTTAAPPHRRSPWVTMGIAGVGLAAVAGGIGWWLSGGGGAMAPPPKRNGTAEVASASPNPSVPGAATVTNTAPQNTQPPTTAPPATTPTSRADAARQAAMRWILELGGTATVITGADAATKQVHRAEDVPDGAWTWKELSFADTPLRDADLADMPELHGLKSLSLRKTAVGDAGMVQVGRLSDLTTLDLSGTRVTDAGLAALDSLVDLQDLNVRDTTITDEGVARLATLTRLEKLYLGDNRVTDKGLAALKPLLRLRQLELEGTDVTQSAVAALTSALPELAVIWTPPAPDRLIARSVLDQGGSIEVRLAGKEAPVEVRRLADLPADDFKLSTIRLTNVREVPAAVLSGLTQLTELERLDLAGSGASTPSLDAIEPLKQLRELSLGKLDLDPLRVEALRGALPECRITWDRSSDREVAAWVCQRGGWVSVALPNGELQTEIKEGTPLPAGPFTLRAISLRETADLADDDLARMAGLAQLESLDLSNTPIGNAGLEHLAGCRGLRELNLSQTKIDDTGLARLAALTSLRSLQLAGTAVTDAGIGQLRSLGELEQLSLAGTGVTDASAGVLTRFPKLTWLSLANSTISDAAVPQLVKLTGLTDLRLDGTQVSDAGGEELQRALRRTRIAANPAQPQRAAARWVLEQGGVLTLDSGEVSSRSNLPRGACVVKKVDLTGAKGSLGDGLATLAACDQLGELVLKGTRVGDADLAHLSSLSQLTSLDLSQTAVTDAGLAALAPLTGLRTLVLDGTKVSGLGLESLADQVQLERLQMAETHADAKGLAVVARFKSLTVLDLGYNPDVGDEAVAALAKLVELRELTLRGAQVGDASMTTVARFKKLRRLDLGSTTVGDSGVGQIARLPEIEWLQLYNTQLTNGGLSSLGQMRTLRTLNITKTQTTREAADQLQQQMPNCRISR